MKEKLKEVNLITKTGRINPNARAILEKYPELKEQIFKSTAFLKDESSSLGERIFCIFHDIYEQPLCKTCKTPVHFIRDKKQYNSYCSVKCAKNDPDLLGLWNQKMKGKKEEIRQKIINTKKQTSEEQKQLSYQKRIDTILSRYGSIENLITQNKQKQHQTNILKYGVSACSQHNVIRQKIKNNHHKTNHDLNLNNEEWLKERHLQEQNSLQDIANERGVSKYLVWTKMREFQIPVKHYYRSIPQQRISDFLTLNGVEHTTNVNNIIGKQQLDILINKHNIAVEVNGVFWHSELNGKHRNYHLEKTQKCLAQNIELLHFWDFEIKNKFEVVCSIILSKLNKTKKIHARKCGISLITSKQAYDFHQLYHLSGGVYSSINYGLFFEDKLIQVLSFTKNRFNTTKDVNCFEITRFSTILNTTVNGGFSKLLKFFIRNHKPKTIITFSDNRISNGDVYKKNGFLNVTETKPNYFYFHQTDTNKVFSRQKFQKHKLSKLLEHFDANKSEWENMKKNNYNRIWDCGNKKWVLNVS